MHWYRFYQRCKLRIVPRLRGKVLSVEIHNSYLGLFAHLSWCLEVIQYCEQHGLTAQLSATSPQYRDPSRPANWLTYFFDLVEKTPHVDFRVSHRDEFGFPLNYFRGRTLEQQSALVAGHLRLKEDLVNTLACYSDEHFIAKKILGIHYRGTDKAGEAPRASWETMRETVANYLQAHSDVDGLFVATDEAGFYEFMKDTFPGTPVLPLQSKTKAHFQTDLSSGNYAKGREALVDCLLLSRCSALIRTASFLSAWASLFNPKLPIVLVNRPYPGKLWFPESELAQRSMDEYLPAELRQALQKGGCLL